MVKRVAATTERMERELAIIPTHWADAGPFDGRSVEALRRRGLVETRLAERVVDVRWGGFGSDYGTRVEHYWQVRKVTR